VAIQRIAGLADSRLSDYRGIREADLLRRRQLFVAEGRLVVRRVIAEPRFQVQSLLVNDAALCDLADSIDALAADVPVFVCPTDAFEQLTGFNLHRGCLALVNRPPPAPFEEVVAGARIVLVLDGIGNADNVGGIFRNAAAFGAVVITGPGSCDPLYRKAIRTSMGAALQVPFCRCDAAGWLRVAEQLRAAGFAVVALTPRAPSDALDDVAARVQGAPVAVVLGAEGSGVSPALEAAADWRARIPISGRVDSLNVAVASAIALYRFTAAQ
jgi:tRNA G18 (ribose-2'-O)-methylase SpoU